MIRDSFVVVPDAGKLQRVLAKMLGPYGGDLTVRQLEEWGIPHSFAPLKHLPALPQSSLIFRLVGFSLELLGLEKRAEAVSAGRRAQAPARGGGRTITHSPAFDFN